MFVPVITSLLSLYSNFKSAVVTLIDLLFVLPCILVKKYAYVNPNNANNTIAIPTTLTIIFCFLLISLPLS